MQTFKGFTNSESFTQLPDTFFQQLLKQIDDAAELKVTLYFLWWVEHVGASSPALRETDFEPQGLGLSAAEIRTGLEKAVERGSILKVMEAGSSRPTAPRSRSAAETYFLLNSPRGRAVAQSIEQGTWDPEQAQTSAPLERPNIFRLYEENIGPLTPLIADALKDAEETYPAEWVAETIELAVRNNKRSWKYCEAILRRWKEEGRGQKQDRRDAEKDRDNHTKYTKGEYADYLK